MRVYGQVPPPLPTYVACVLVGAFVGGWVSWWVGVGVVLVAVEVTLMIVWQWCIDPALSTVPSRVPPSKPTEISQLLR